MMGMERGFSMNNDMDQIILVDLSDNEIGSANKMDAHFQCLLHRAFSIFIVNHGKMLVQKRNKNKYHSGGLITNACCSHPRKGELLEEAIHRRLLEEMGMDCPLEEISSFVYRNVFENGISEYEFECMMVISTQILKKQNVRNGSILKNYQKMFLIIHKNILFGLFLLCLKYWSF